MRPGKFLLYPFSSSFPHLLTPLRVIHQCGDLPRKVKLVVWASICSRILGRNSVLGEIRGHNRLAQYHAFHLLWAVSLEDDGQVNSVRSIDPRKFDDCDGVGRENVGEIA